MKTRVTQSRFGRPEYPNICEVVRGMRNEDDFIVRPDPLIGINKVLAAMEILFCS